MTAVDRPGVVFVNHHSEALIQPRAEQLLHAGFLVRVADNSSTYPDHEVRVNIGRNVGFGAACNRGVDALPSSVTRICLHNPDVTIDTADIVRLTERLARLSNGGACAPAIRVGDKIRVNGFHYPGLLREAWLSLRGVAASRQTPRPHPRQGSVRRVRGHGRRFASAALLIVDRRAYQSIGGFDERFFLYGEDLDLWHRLTLGGYGTAFEPAVVARHDSATGSSATRGTRELLRWVGVEFFAQKHSYASWQSMRRVHRPLIGRLAIVRPNLLDLVTDLWSRSATPEETSVAVSTLAAEGNL
jgi:N-acetylglucosaminyl-diphospho-decaprenol L-rhamnosyltransferase